MTTDLHTDLMIYVSGQFAYLFYMLIGLVLIKLD